MSESTSERDLEREKVKVALGESIRAMEGMRLNEVTLHVVSSEINLVLLRFDEGSYAVYPWWGGELVVVMPWDREVPAELGPASWYQAYYEAAPFIGRQVKQARAIGDVWNGHGIEISFSGELERTLVIQSIASGDLPEGYIDCIRVGVAKYTYCIEDSEKTGMRK